MSFKSVKIIDPYVENGTISELKLTLATLNQVHTLEAELGINMPVGYKEYVTTLGFGEYCNYIRIDMPSKILSEYKERQQSLKQYWFWEMGEHILSKERATESIEVGSTNDGDSIIFHPSNPNELFVLPRNDDMLHKIGDNIDEAIEWLCVYRQNPYSGSVGEDHERRYFVPYNSLNFVYPRIHPQNI